MAEVLFISPEYLKGRTPLDGAVDETIINSAILVAQDIHVKQYLGTALYNKLKSDVESSSLSGNYATLLNDYIKPTMVWWTMVELYPSLYVKHDNGSVAIRISDDTQTIDKGVLDSLVNNARQKAQTYNQLMVDYLGAYSSLFPEYTNVQYPNRPPRRDNYNENGMFFSRGNNDISRRTTNNTADKWYLPSWMRD